MNFIAEIQIMPLPEVIEPQGRTLQSHLHQLPMAGIQQVRVGKFIQLSLLADSEQEAHAMVTQACEKLLAHPLVETYAFILRPVTDQEIDAIEPEVITDTEPVEEAATTRTEEE